MPGVALNTLFMNRVSPDLVACTLADLTFKKLCFLNLRVVIIFYLLLLWLLSQTLTYVISFIEVNYSREVEWSCALSIKMLRVLLTCISFLVILPEI